MSDTRRIKQGQTSPALRLTLKEDGAALDVAAATSILFSLKTDPHTGETQQTLVDGQAMTEPGGTGVVEYAFSAGETDAWPIGKHQGEVIVLWSGGTESYFPSEGFFTIEVYAAL